MATDDWLKIAKSLPLGGKQRFAHECGRKKDAIVSHNEQGYSCYCFKCGPVGFHGHGYQTLEDLERIRSLNTLAQKEQTHEIPPDTILDIPPEHFTWLSMGGISADRAKSLNIGWSPRHGRIILPLYGTNGTCLYWQGRAVSKGQFPKYTNPPVPKNDLIYWVHPDSGPTEDCVVTEDILSAIRVGKHISAGSILGTKTSNGQASQLRGYRRVTYFLDPDLPGVEGAKKGARTLSLVTSTSTITADKDPKNYSDRELREILGLPPNHRYEVIL